MNIPPCRTTSAIKQARRLDVLFVSEKPLWPVDQGYRIRGSQMSAALARLGLRVGVAVMDHRQASAAGGLDPSLFLDWPETNASCMSDFTRIWRDSFFGPLRTRLARHQGIDLQAMAGVRTLAKRHQPRAVIALGQHGPVMLQGLADLPCKTVWYAADDPIRFTWSCMKRERWQAWPERLRQIAFYTLYENAFVRGCDGCIAVNPVDARMLKLIGGAKKTLVIRNGVDLDHFKPDDAIKPQPRSLVFWGRLDFEPNIDALQWFAAAVWPRLKQAHPDATWTIMGKFPDARIAQLGLAPGVNILANVPDIRPCALENALTILPMRCGGGIKNKLLEAAAMARPIIATPLAMQGLKFDPQHPPARLCETPEAWVAAISRLWQSPQEQTAIGAHARQWVCRHHSWDTAARELTEGILEETITTTPMPMAISPSPSRALEAA